MKISVDEVPQSPKEVQFSENIEELQETYRQSINRDFGFPPRLDVDLVYYRSGEDIFFTGNFHGPVTGNCGRCLDPYNFTLAKEFEFVLTPDSSKSDRRAEELRREDLGLSYYSSDEIDLAPLIREQVILALPTRPLCSENCRGLCVSCGTNRNRETCSCAATTSDPRMAIFRNLKVSR
jgi:uncharacterized protein